MYNCTPTRPRVFCWGTRQQLAVPKQPCLTPTLLLSLCSNQAFQNSRVSVSLCSLVRIPLCVSLQQLAVPKQPCLQPHCLCLSLQLGPNTFVSASQIALCLVATTARSKATLSTTPVSVFAAWSEYACVCVSDTLVSRCNNSAFQSNPAYNPTVCVSLQLGPNTFVSASQIALCLVATTARSKATLSTTPLSVSLCNNWPFQNNPFYNPFVRLCSLVPIPLCLCFRHPCVSLQQLSVPKQPCLQFGPNTPLSVSHCNK